MPCAIGFPESNNPPTNIMKAIAQSLAVIALVFGVSNCTAYIDPDGPDASRTTTTRTISEDPYAPGGASVTTRQTTTRY
jgi:hypothetical protein